jgi:hypothetical protein
MAQNDGNKWYLGQQRILPVKNIDLLEVRT